MGNHKDLFTMKFNTNTYLISDLHFEHRKDFIHVPRGFHDYMDYYNTMLTNWNATVTHEDSVLVLGDTIVGARASNQDPEKCMINFLKTFNFGEIFLMPGNHPSGYSQILNKSVSIGNFIYEYENDFNKKVYLIPNYFEIFINNDMLVLSHYPIYEWNNSSKGSWMIYGHTHGHLSPKVEGKTLEVSPDVIGMRPISYFQLKEILDKLPRKSFRNRDSNETTLTSDT